MRNYNGKKCSVQIVDTTRGKARHVKRLTIYADGLDVLKAIRELSDKGRFAVSEGKPAKT